MIIKNKTSDIPWFFQNADDVFRHKDEFKRALANHHWERTDTGGIYFSKQNTFAEGIYRIWDSNDPTVQVAHNLLTTEGFNYLWTAGVGNGTQKSAFYGLVGSNNTAPADTWTNANVASNATELTTQLANATRPEFTDSAAASKSTNNTASPMVFTTAADSQTVYIIGLSSASAKGSTSGSEVLLSVTNIGTARTLPVTGDKLNVDVTLTFSNP